MGISIGKSLKLGEHKKAEGVFGDSLYVSDEYVSDSEMGLFIWRRRLSDTSAVQLLVADGDPTEDFGLDAFGHDYTTISDYTSPSLAPYGTMVDTVHICIDNITPYANYTTADIYINQWEGAISSNTSFYDDVSIAKNTTLTLGSNVTVSVNAGEKFDVYGTLALNSGSKITRLSGSDWSGIDLQSNGVRSADGDCTIEYATCGIDMYGGSISNNEYTITIQNCSSAGLSSNSGSQTIQNVRCKGCTGYYGGIMKTGVGNNPLIRYNTVETSKHGLYIGGNISVDHCDLKNMNTNHTITYCSAGTMDLEDNNNIIPISGAYKAINNRTDTTTDAEYNWWGTDSPTDALFAYPAYVDYSPSCASPLGVGVYKKTDNQTPRKKARELECDGDYAGALAVYKEILAAETNPNWRQFIITSMLRIHDRYDQQYDELRTIAENEKKSAEGYNGAVLRFIISDIDVREGNYQQSIDDLARNAEFYKGTDMEVEMLGRIAEIYGLYLNDKSQALLYAQKAAAVNPGQLSLRSAFNAADVEYETALYEDRFKDVVHNYATPEDSEEQILDEATNSVAVSPNPFNPVTTISYSIVEDGHVTLSVYNLAGQKVATLVDSSMPAGTHHAVFDGSHLASGMYFYRFETKNFASNGKMMIVK